MVHQIRRVVTLNYDNAKDIIRKQYDGEQETLLTETIDWLLTQAEKMERVAYEIEHSDMGTAIDNIIEIVNE